MSADPTCVETSVTTIEMKLLRDGKYAVPPSGSTVNLGAIVLKGGRSRVSVTVSRIICACGKSVVIENRFIERRQRVTGRRLIDVESTFWHDGCPHRTEAP